MQDETANNLEVDGQDAAELARWMVVAARAYRAYSATVDPAWSRTELDKLPRPTREGWAAAAREACRAFNDLKPGPGRE